MKLSQFKQHLEKVSQLNFIQPNGTFVPRHFHITEVGLMTKHFIDCGGTVRIEKTVGFQIWIANDFEHRLEPQKLKTIIGVAENLFGNEDLEIEVAFQSETISCYGLDFNGQNFVLTIKETDCLAKDHCGIPQENQIIKLAELQTAQKSSCTPGGGCC